MQPEVILCWRSGCFCFPLTDFIYIFFLYTHKFRGSSNGNTYKSSNFLPIVFTFWICLEKYLWKESEIKQSNLVIRLGRKLKNLWSSNRWSLYWLLLVFLLCKAVCWSLLLLSLWEAARERQAELRGSRVSYYKRRRYWMCVKASAFYYCLILGLGMCSLPLVLELSLCPGGCTQFICHGWKERDCVVWGLWGREPTVKAGLMWSLFLC